MKLFFRISVLVLCILMSLSSFADDKKDRISPEVIDWSGYNQSLETIVSTSADPKKIYLYATTPNKFVTVGGRYGAQPIFAEVGMNFYVEKIADDADNRYYIHSWVNNPTTSQETGNADYLGVEPLMDTDQRIFLTKPETDEMKSIYLYVDRGKLNTHDDNTHSSANVGKNRHPRFCCNGTAKHCLTHHYNRHANHHQYPCCFVRNEHPAQDQIH